MDEFQEQARELEARRIERRRFLRGALGVSGLALLQGMPFARALARPGTGTLPSPANAPIDTFVILMMENRSFDHVLGWLPGADGVQAGFSNPSKLAPAPNGCPSNAPLPVADATPVETFRLEQHCHVPDPDHSWNGSRIQLNHGRMDGFADRSGPIAMGYLTEEDMPFTGWLARSYTAYDHYFCSVMGPTFPNREYLFAAQAGGVKTNEMPLPTPSNPYPTGYTWTTIMDRLTAAGVSWASYFSDVPAAALFFNDFYDRPERGKLGRFRYIADYYADAAAGTLPQVVFLDPSFFTVGNDDHPARDIKLGQRFIQDAFLALAQGPQWERSAFVLTYDEHGGFYDHVPPPRTADDRASADHCEDWGQLGFRVPTVLASPYARSGLVATQTYDHASILKMIEWRFGLAPLTMRDAAARNLAETLDFDQPPRVDLPSAPPFVPYHTAGAYCWVNQVPEHSHGDNPLEPVPDAPIPAPARPHLPQEEEPHAELRALADSGFFGRLDLRDMPAKYAFRD